MMLRRTLSLCIAAAVKAAMATEATAEAVMASPSDSTVACPATSLRSTGSPIWFPHSRCRNDPVFSISSRLTHMARAYATTTPPLEGSHNDPGDEGVHRMNDGNVGAAAAHLQHAPTLRSALPPSAVELPEESFLKCIDKEIFDEKVRLDKEDGPPPVPMGWTMHHTEGTSFIYGRRLWVPPPSPRLHAQEVETRRRKATMSVAALPRRTETESSSERCGRLHGLWNDIFYASNSPPVMPRSTLSATCAASTFPSPSLFNAFSPKKAMGGVGRE
uniref:WW domain-containing protein n=1 Tax=Leishmania guyanensis TaxID=5670 RepID=A0A1E1INW6_LEIGU